MARSWTRLLAFGGLAGVGLGSAGLVVAPPSSSVRPAELVASSPAQPVRAELRFDLLKERRTSRSLALGDHHVYRADLKAGQLLDAVVEQLGVDVRLDLFGPGGKLLTAVDSPNSAQGKEEVLLVAPQSGSYAMVVTARSQPPPGSTYLLRKVEVRGAAPGDRQRASALQAYFAVRLGDRAKLLQALRAAVPSLEKTSAPKELRAYAWDELAKVYENQKKWRESARCYRRAAQLFHKLGLGSQEAKALIGAGHTEIQVLAVDRALAHFNQALSLARSVGDEVEEACASLHLGMFYTDRADAWNAKPYLERAIAIRRNRRDVEGESGALTVLALMLRNLGEYEEALKIYQDELQRLKLSPQRRAIVLTELASLYTNLGKPDDAFRCLQEAFALQKQGADLRSQANTLVAFGRAYASKKDLENTLSSYQAALAIYRTQNDLRAQATTLMNVGWTLGSLGRYDDATDASGRALSLAHQLKQPILEGGALLGLAWTERLRGDLSGARQRAEAALERIESTRSGIRDQDYRLSYFSTLRDTYDFLIQVVMEQYQLRRSRDLLERALEISESARSRVLLDALGEREGNGAKRLASVLSARRIQRQVLDRDTVLLEYSLGQPKSYLFFVTPDEIERFELPPREEIERMARDTRGALAESQTRGGRIRAIRKAMGLSRVLIGPVADRLGEKRLLIVASGALQLVPLGALPDPAAPVSGQAQDLVWPEPLLRRHEVFLEPSASVLAGIRRARASRRAPPGLLAVLADAVYERDDPRFPGASVRQGGGSDPVLGYLPRLLGSRQEAEGIADGLPSAQVFKGLGFTATRDLVKSGKLRKYRVLHIAAHTYYSDQSPEFSALLLSRYDSLGRPRDGLLRIKDISSQELRSDLVVLSSCGSALGKAVWGEGVVGWPWTFLSAGASEVVTSLWNVGDDSTADLMQRFYGNMLRGLSSSEALREAQLQVWNEGKGKGPWSWGGFVAQGEWNLHPLSLNKAPAAVSSQDGDPRSPMTTRKSPAADHLR